MRLNLKKKKRTTLRAGQFPLRSYLGDLNANGQLAMFLWAFSTSDLSNW